MKIAIDITPIKGEMTGHRVRGVGFYLEYLKRSLLTYYPENDYIFFAQGEKIDPTVDLVHYPYFEPFFVTLPLLKNKKRIITVHDLTPLVFPDHFPAGIKGTLSWQVQKINLLRSEGIITDSYASQKDIAKYTTMPEKKIHSVYLAAGEEFKQKERGTWQQELVKKYNLPTEFILYVGDVTWNKNLSRLVRAMKQIDIPLVMIGKSLTQKDFDRTNIWNKDLVEVQQMTENDNRFIKLGFVPTDDLVALYNMATVFVFPSIYEGFGLPVLEAMQCGCPVITTNGGSLGEVAGDAAYYVDGYDEESIAHGIEKVFSNQNLQKSLSQKGKEQAKKFSWKKTAEKTILAYKNILKK